MPLRFATESAFTKSYREGQEYGQEQRLRDQRIRSGDQDYDIKAEQRPYDLRRVTADTEGAESTTRVKIGTEGADIAKAGSAATQAEADARRAGTEADSSAFDYGQDQINAPNISRRIGSEADTAGTNAQRQEFELGEERATAPDARRTSRANAETAEQQARGARGNADFALNRRSYDLFDKSMQALANGDIAAAQAYAQQNGQTIPEAVLNDATLQRGMAELWKDAVKYFPNQPRAQVEFLKNATKQMMDTRGQLQYDPVKSLGVPGTGTAPQPPTNTMGVQRAGARPVADADGIISGLNLSAADARLVAIAKQRATEPAPYGIGSPTVNFEMMADLIAQGGKPEIAAIFDQKYRQTAPLPPPPGAGPGIVPQPSGINVPMAPRPGAQPGMAPQSGRPATPPQLRGVAQLQWSPSRQVFRDGQTGFIYDGQGNRLRQ